MCARNTRIKPTILDHKLLTLMYSFKKIAIEPAWFSLHGMSGWAGLFAIMGLDLISCEQGLDLISCRRKQKE